MTENEARQWLADRFTEAECDKLGQFVRLLIAQAETQNLIARSTLDHIWSRHIVDSAQLIDDTPTDGPWIDIGSGGGLPGVVIAIIRPGPVALIEPRRKRANFLQDAAVRLELHHVKVHANRAQNFSGMAGVVSARAVASMEDMFGWTRTYVSRETIYVLPRGKGWQQDIANAKRNWQGMFHVKQSITNPNSAIVHATRISEL